VLKAKARRLVGGQGLEAIVERLADEIEHVPLICRRSPAEPQCPDTGLNRGDDIEIPVEDRGIRKGRADRFPGATRRVSIVFLNPIFPQQRLVEQRRVRKTLWETFGVASWGPAAPPRFPFGASADALSGLSAEKARAISRSRCPKRARYSPALVSKSLPER